MKYLILILFFSFSITTYSQSDIEKILKGGEIIINGLSFLKTNKIEQASTQLKVIESICVKNKLTDRITFKLTGLDENGNEIKKELVITKDGKECVFAIVKGIYTYEIILSNKEIYKKGEYKFNEQLTITIKED